MLMTAQSRSRFPATIRIARIVGLKLLGCLTALTTSAAALPCARAELPPAAYEGMRGKYPESLTIRIPTTPELPQWRGQYDGDADFSTQLIRTQERWARFWGRLSRPLPQAIDETREMAVFIAAGQRPTGGFKPRVVSATESDGHLVVTYTDGKPSPDRFVTQVLTHPWVVAIVPKTALPVTFKKVE